MERMETAAKKRFRFYVTFTHGPFAHGCGGGNFQAESRAAAWNLLLECYSFENIVSMKVEEIEAPPGGGTGRLRE